MVPESLTFSVTVADLLIAILSLGGGGYAGSKAAAISRMRLEVRRQLVDEQFPALDKAVAPPHFELDAAESELDKEIVRCRWIVSYSAAMSEVDKLIDLLPWPDRIAWQRLLSDAGYKFPGIDKLDPVARELRLAKESSLSEEETRERMRSVPGIILEDFDAVFAQFQNPREGGNPFAGYEPYVFWSIYRKIDIDPYLNWQLRPTLKRRLLSLRYKRQLIGWRLSQMLKSDPSTASSSPFAFQIARHFTEQQVEQMERLKALESERHHE